MHAATGAGDVAPGWEARFRAGLLRGDPLAAATALREAGAHGVVRRAQLDRAGALLTERPLASLVARDWATRLLAHPRRVDKALAAMLLGSLVVSHPGEVERAVLRLGRDERWDVRELAIGLLAAAFRRAPERYAASVVGWMARPEPVVRRVVLRAVARAARDAGRAHARRWLDLVEIVIGDPHPEVVRTVGPVTLPALVRLDPDAALERAAEWARSADPTTRRAVAAALAKTRAAALAARTRPIREALAADPDLAVRRAAAPPRGRTAAAAD